MNVEIWTQATQFPEKEYINGIFLAVHGLHICTRFYCPFLRTSDVQLVQQFFQSLEMALSLL